MIFQIFLIMLIGITFIDLFFIFIIASGYGILFIISTQILSTILGGMKLKKTNIDLFFVLEAELKKKNLIVKELWEEVLFLSGACLLIFPGYLTDIIGLLLLNPEIKSYISDWFRSI